MGDSMKHFFSSLRGGIADEAIQYFQHTSRTGLLRFQLAMTKQ